MNERWKSLILDHYKNPRFFGEMPVYDFASEQHNRTCGDNVKVFAALDAAAKLRCSFIGAGCSLCMASASLMMELVQDIDRREAVTLRDAFLEMWNNGTKDGDARDIWQALDGLRQYPVRSRCVKLAWQALDEILQEWAKKEQEKERGPDFRE